MTAGRLGTRRRRVAGFELPHNLLTAIGEFWEGDDLKLLGGYHGSNLCLRFQLASITIQWNTPLLIPMSLLYPDILYSVYCTSQKPP
jgi:hypothetical protein